MTCDCDKHEPKKCSGSTPSVLQINNVECPVLFHTIKVPASSGTPDTNPPMYGDHHNTRIIYESDNSSYLYDSDGIPQMLSDGGVNNIIAKTAPTISTKGVLGQLYTDTSSMHTYQLTSIDKTNPDNIAYNWTQRW